MENIHQGMPKLTVQIEGSSRVFDLKEGVNRIGRSPDNDIVIPVSEVSGQHCEISLSAGSLRVMDLGSRNGTFIDGHQVREAGISAGQKLRFGPVEAIVPPDSTLAAPPVASVRKAAAPVAAAASVPGPPPVPPPVPSLRAQVCLVHPAAPGEWLCPKCATHFCGACAKDGRQFGLGSKRFCPGCNSVCEPVGQASLPGAAAAPALRGQTSNRAPASMGSASFNQLLASAWAYPFLKDGLILMIVGSLFFGFLDFVSHFPFAPGFARRIALVFGWGYLASYLQKIIHFSAQGEPELPPYPDFSNYYEDVVRPFFMMFGTFALSLAPVFLMLMFPLREFVIAAAQGITPEEGPILAILATFGFLLVGMFIMPMNFLSVAMHDQISALNPFLTLPSIKLVLGNYLLVFVQFVVLAIVQSALELVFHKLNILVVSDLLVSFTKLYFIIVQARTLGMLYYKNRRELGWF